MFPRRAPPGSLMTRIPDSLVFRSAGEELGDIWDRLELVIKRAGFDELSTYGVDTTGFAVVCRMERIESDGTSAANRWAACVTGDSSVFYLEKIIEELAGCDPGRYRMIVIIVSPHPPSADGPEMTENEITELQKRGRQFLWSRLRHETKREHVCLAYVNEFLRREKGGRAEPYPESALRTSDHLVGSGLWTAHELGR